MTIATFTIPSLPSDAKASGGLELFEALALAAEAPSTRKLMRDSRAAGVRSHMVLPIADSSHVDPRALGRAFRHALKAALAGAGAGEGDTVLIAVQTQRDGGAIDVSAGAATEFYPDKPASYWDTLPWDGPPVRGQHKSG